MSNLENNPRNVAEDNLRKLLTQAYCPQQPPAGFVEATLRRMQQAAHERSGEAKTARKLQFPSWGLSAMAAAAAVVIFGISAWLALQKDTPVATVAIGEGQVVKSIESLTDNSPTTSPAAATRAPQALGEMLTPRKKDPAPQAQALAVGQSVETGKGEKKRLALPDGSMLYVNQLSRLTLAADRRVELARGEVFVEVAPRSKDQQKVKFSVVTPQRQVIALGTKFQVSAEPAKTNVLVTQGSVVVAGPKDQAGDNVREKFPVVQAGRQLTGGDGGDKVEPAGAITQELDWTRELVAQSETPLVPESAHAGGELIALDPNGQEMKLSLRKYHVDVHIEDGFARTTIDQTYFNHENRRLEGTFYFPLPPDASLSRLAMYCNGQLNEGGMAERDYARQVYESIVTRMQDPALLEWVDGSTFKMRVFPLEARQEKRIILSYVQRLEVVDGQAAYRFPGGHTLEFVRDWSFHARVKDGKDSQWSSESHEFSAKQDGGDLLVDAQAKNVKLDKDLVLRVRDSAASEAVRFRIADHEGSQYLMVSYRPELAAMPTRQQRDWVFVFEASADRNPLLARAQIDILKNVLTNAEHEDRFSVLAANTRVHAWSDALVPVTADNIAAAVAYLEKTHLVGALDLEAALTAGRKMLESSSSGHLVHLGSGVPILGQKGADALFAKTATNVKYVGVGVGKRWDRNLMQAGASRTGGYFTQINPDENIPWRAMELVSTLNTPRLMNIQVADASTVGPAAFLGFEDSIRQGEEVAAVTRVDGGRPLPKAVIVSGMFDGKPFTHTVEVSQAHGKADYLPRMWAKLEIDRLLNLGADASKARIVELSKSMYVMSPFTSLLVLENEDMYKQYKVDRGRKDHWAMYATPDKIQVVTEPLKNQPIPATVQKTDGRPNCEQVLGTIVVRNRPTLLSMPGYNYRVGRKSGSYGWAGNEEYIEFSLGARFDYDASRKGYAEDNGRIGFGNLIGVSSAARLSLHGLSTYGGSSGRYFEQNKQLIDLDKKLSEVMRDRLPADIERAKEERAEWTDFERFPKRWREWTLADTVGPMPARLQPVSTPIAAPSPIVLPSTEPWGAGQKKAQAEAMLSKIYIAADRNPGNHATDGAAILRLDSSVQFYKSRPADGWMYSGDDIYRASDYWAGDGYYLDGRYGQLNLSTDWRNFSDIISYAPGMNTTMADIYAVLENEASDFTQPAVGTIDPIARKLIDRARRPVWREVIIRPASGHAFTVAFDGAGQFAWQRRLDCGLTQRVVCDGKTLWHAYAELGLVARRTVSRYHQQEFEAMVPFVVLSAEELARGANVKLVDANTVALTPIAAKDDQPQVQVLLVFGNDGQLRQRKAVLVQKNTDGTQTTQMVWQQTLGDDGAVTVSNCTKNPPQTDKYELRIARGPSLSVDESLVVVPMPIRSADFLRKQPDVASQTRGKWSTDLTLQWMMANLDGDWTQVRDAAAEFIRKDDHRIGLFVLMSSCQGNWTATSGVGTGREGLEFDPQKHFPNSSLAALIAGQAQMRTSGNYKEVPVVGSEVGGFTGNLTEMFNLVYLWTQSKAGRDTTFTRRDGNRLVNFVTSSGWMEGNTAALMLPQYYVGGNWFNDMVGQNTAALVDTTDLSAYSRLQIAQAIAGKDTPAAARMYVRLFNEALDRGGVPYVDNGFRNAVATAEQAKVNDFPAGTWNDLMKKAAKSLADRGDRLGLLVLMRQCWSFGDTAMAEEMFEQALAGADETERGMVQLTAVQMLYHVGQYDRAWIIVQDMLRDKKWGDDPYLLRIGSTLASNRGRLAQSLRYLEKAMEIEYRQLPEVINLEVVRRDYSELLGRYQQVAVALATLDDEPSQDLMSRVVRAADRWRMLDSDDQAASMAASKALQTLGAQDLAWDYLTTPLAMKPNEAQPWLGMAQNLRNEQQYDLAGRAYASAFAAEGSNAQILWDWAQMLQQAGKTAQAREVYRKIADGDWQPKFNSLKEQAKRQTGR